MLIRSFRVARVPLVTALALSFVALGPGRALALEGDADPAFHVNGVTTDVAGGDSGNAMAVLGNGKIVVAGSATGQGLDTAVVRYTAAGALDSAFDGDGKQVVAVGSGNDQANAVAIAPDGKIVVAGFVTGIVNDTTVLRFNRNGSPDSTFDGDGMVVTPVVPNVDNVANAVAVQADGKIVVVGTARNGNDADFEIVRYRTDGSLDPTFDGPGPAEGNGIVTLDLGTSTDRGNAVAIQENGKIVVAGESFDLGASVERPIVARLLSDGALDQSFGSAGVGRTNHVGAFNAVTTGEDGRIVAAGFGTIGGNDLVLTATFPADGSSVQSNFAVDGFSNTHATGVALQPDGKIVVSTTGSLNGLARLTPNGADDPTFGTKGLVGPPALNGGAANGVAVMPEGEIVVGGTAGEGSFADFAAARVLGDQTPPWGARMIRVPRYSLADSRTVSWTASDIGTGVAAFDVRSRTARSSGGSFGPFSPFRTKTPDVFGTFAGTPGHTYCLQVRGRDFAGNVGAFGAQSCEAIPLDERALTATGSWTDLSGAGFYRGTAMSSKTAGSKLVVDVAYRHLAVVVTTCPACGTLRVLLGTTLLETVHLSGSTTRHSRVIQVDAPTTQRAGTITLRQASNGKPVIVEGLAVSRS